jgi:hypothetical protein
LSRSSGKPTIWKLLNVEEEISDINREYENVVCIISIGYYFGNPESVFLDLER